MKMMLMVDVLYFALGARVVPSLGDVLGTFWGRFMSTKMLLAKRLGMVVSVRNENGLV